MSIWQDILGTTKDTFGISLNGPKLKDNAGVLEVRNTADNAYAQITSSQVNVTGDQIVLNSDGAGGADSAYTIQRPTTGMAGAVTLTLPQTSGTVALIETAGTVTSVEVTSESAALTVGGDNPITSDGTITLDLDPDLTAIAAVTGTGISTRTADNTWVVRSITGTSDRIGVTNADGVAGNPTIDIAATYVGQTSITTVGTIGTGTWEGTEIGPTFGGTGLTTYAAGSLIYASAADTLDELAVGTNDQVLTVVGGVPTWQTPSEGGTVTSVAVTSNSAALGVSGSPITTSGTIALTLDSDLTAVGALAGTGFSVRTGTGTWDTRSVTGETDRISVTNADGIAGDPVIDISANYVGQTSITTLGTIATGTWEGTEVGPTFGGTGLTGYTAGSLIYASATDTLAELAVGTNTHVLTVVGGVPTWQAPTATSAGGSSTQIQYNNGGAFAGDADFTWDSTNNILTLGSSATNGTIQPLTSSTGNGAALNLRGGNTTNATSTGGAVSILSGSSSDGVGGAVSITANNGIGTNRGGGAVTITAGTSTGNAQGGSTTIQGGSGGTAGGTGGPVIITAGSATGSGSVGSNVQINGGTGVASNGNIQLRTNNTNRLVIDGTGAWLLAGAAGTSGQVLTSAGTGTPPAWQTPTTVSPGGSTTQIQFNNAGAFGGDAGFTWTSGTQTLLIGTGPGGGVIAGPDSSTTHGPQLLIRGGTTSATTGTAGGNILIRGGTTSAANNGRGGAVELIGGPGSGSNSNGGDTYVRGGTTGTSGTAGSVFINGGNSSAVGTDGNVTIAGGTGSTNTKGYLSFLTSSVERLRILANGAWSVGTAGTNTGTSGQVLTSTGNTTAPTWQTPTTVSPGGSSGQIQFNDGGAFGGDAGLTYDSGTDTLTTSIVETTTGIFAPIVTATTSMTIGPASESDGGLTLRTDGIGRLSIGSDGDWLVGGTVGTAGQVLTSNGSNAEPTWEDADFVSLAGATMDSGADITFSGGGEIFGLPATPTTDGSAASKAYVDAVAAGITWKNSVEAATTANVTLSGEQTIDGVALTEGDRVLVKNQTTASENGIYIVDPDAWTRSEDFDEASPIDEINGAAVFVQNGTTQANTGWVQTSDVADVGTDTVTFTQFSGVGSGVASLASANAALTFNSATGAITATVVADGVGISVGGSGLQLVNNGVTNAKFRQSAGLSVVGNGTDATANVADITGTANQVLRVSSDGTTLAFGAINLASGGAVTGTLPLTNGGTGQTTAVAAFDALAPTTTKGDLIVSTGVTNQRVAVGTNGQVLVANSATTPGVEWQPASNLNPAALTTDSTTVNFDSDGTIAAFTLPANGVVDNVKVIIDTPFDGTPTLAVGIAGTANKYMATTDNLLTDAAKTVFINHPGEAPVGGTEAIQIAYSAGGAAAGVARVIVTYSVPN